MAVIAEAISRTPLLNAALELIRAMRFALFAEIMKRSLCAQKLDVLARNEESDQMYCLSQL